MGLCAQIDKIAGGAIQQIETSTIRGYLSNPNKFSKYLPKGHNIFSDNVETMVMNSRVLFKLTDILCKMSLLVSASSHH